MLTRIVTIFLLFTVAATAAEVECPPTSPAGAKLLGGYPEPDNGELTEQLERRGDRWHLVQNLERFDERDAKLICQFADGDIHLAIPGRLLRCDWLGYDAPARKGEAAGASIDTKFLRIWCTPE